MKERKQISLHLYPPDFWLKKKDMSSVERNNSLNKLHVLSLRIEHCLVYVTVSWISNERYPKSASFAMSRVTFYPYSKRKITRFHLGREEIRNEFRQRTVHKMNIDLTYKWSQQLFPSPRYILSSEVRRKCPIMCILRRLICF